MLGNFGFLASVFKVKILQFFCLVVVKSWTAHLLVAGFLSGLSVIDITLGAQL